MPGNYTREQLRNLTQYVKMTDEEFNEAMLLRELGALPIKEFEERIKKRTEEFGLDYDLTDMKINDRLTLRALIQNFITLDDYETQQYRLRLDGVSEQNLNLLNNLSRQMSLLRADISKQQDDLKISRKIRKGDREESTIAFIEGLKDKAKKFYESKMLYIFCPNCHALLGTVWTLNPQSNNTIKLTCTRDLGNKNYCNTVVKVTTKELVERGGTNSPELMPEVMS